MLDISYSTPEYRDLMLNLICHAERSEASATRRSFAPLRMTNGRSGCLVTTQMSRLVEDCP